MKKQTLSALAFAAISLGVSNNTFAQAWTPTGTQGLETNGATTGSIIINGYSKLGVGMNPTEKLSVNGDIGTKGDIMLNWDADVAHRSVFGMSDLFGLVLFADDTWQEGSGIVMNSEGNTSAPGAIDFVATDPQASSSEQAFTFWETDGTGAWDRKLMQINKDGEVIIDGPLRYKQSTGIRTIDGHSYQGGLALYSETNWQLGSGILLHGEGDGSKPGAIDFVSTNDQSSPTESAFTFWKTDIHGVWDKVLMDIKKDGEVIIDGPFRFEQSNGVRTIDGHSYQGGLALYSETDWNLGSGILLHGEGDGSKPGAIDFVSTDHQGSASESAFTFWKTDASGAWTDVLMDITKDGQVAIGDAPLVTSGDYKLYVATGILTEKLKVATVGGGNWSDYVFADDYKLNNLDDVETFISKNKHLPDVPSAEDVEKNGYDVTVMDATLLRKIEELTLYVIEQQKEIQTLKSKMNK